MKRSLDDARFAAAAGFAGLASAGIVEGFILRLLHPAWYPSPLGWAAETLRTAILYGALGVAAFGIAFLLLGPRIRGGREGGAGSNGVRGVATAASLFLLLFLPAGYWVKRLYLPPMRHPATWAAEGGIVLAALLLALLALRASRRPGLRGRTGLLAFPSLALALLAIAIGGIGEALVRRASEDRPNVLLVTIDTLRSDHLSAYGYPRETSPAFDRLAGGGALLTNVVAATPFTQPSTASLITGLYPHTHGVRNHPNLLADRHVTLAEVLRGEGYLTAAFSSHGLLVPEWGFGQGFRLFERVGSPIRFDVTLLGHALWRLGIRRPARSLCADAVTERALRWLRSEPRTPFFLWLHYLDPHFPYVPPEEYARAFDSGTGVDSLTDLQWPDGRRRIFDLTLTEERVLKNVDLYDGEVRFTDDQVARVLGRLEETDLLRRTIAVITADHGESLGEHGLYFAHTHFLYDPAMMIPLAVSYPPEVPPGTKISQTASGLDVMPTILDLAGAPVPEGLEGRSLAPLLRGGKDGPPSAVFGENGRTVVGNLEEENPRWTVEGDAGRWRMVRAGGSKLILIPEPEGDRFELYDLTSDPRETNNIAAENPARADSLKALLLGWIAEEKSGSTFKDEVDEETMRALRELGYIQ
ncbi:MAG: sulfatase [Candidatus Eisenbacteria bacterium]